MRQTTLISMVLFASIGVALTVAQAPGAPRVTHDVFATPDGGQMTYAVSVPETSGNSGTDEPYPLILALHPGGGRTAYYGSSFMRGIVEPALREWKAVIVAPDVPTRTWATDVSDRAVVALVEDVMTRYRIDRSRVLVTGFSLGGHGTWFFASRHADLFTGAIPIAGSPGDSLLDGLETMPIHIIHSRDDDVVPFGPASQTAERLRERGYRVTFTELDGIGHFTMGAYVEPLRDAGTWMMDQWAGSGGAR